MLPAAIENVSIERTRESLVRLVSLDMAAKDVFLEMSSTVEFIVVPPCYTEKALSRLTYISFLLAY